jgi:hypothetical protein
MHASAVGVQQRCFARVAVASVMAMDAVMVMGVMMVVAVTVGMLGVDVIMSVMVMLKCTGVHDRAARHGQSWRGSMGMHVMLQGLSSQHGARSAPALSQ